MFQKFLVRLWRLIVCKKYQAVVSKSDYFDESWYVSVYPDVKMSGMSPLRHYLTHGWREGRKPSKKFDGNAYLEANSDVRAKGICPLAHYEKWGKHEGRRLCIQNGESCKPIAILSKKPDAVPVPVVRVMPQSEQSEDYQLLKISRMFDWNWYLRQYADVCNAGLDPIAHYLSYGWREGRKPGPNFDGNSYREANPDVKYAKICPLVHYERYGKYEARRLFPNKTSTKLSFPFGAESLIYVQPLTVENRFRRVAVFASFSSDGKIHDYVLYYLRKLREVCDAIVMVADNPIIPSELDKLSGLVVYAQFKRHEEYDFGSYKRGYQYAREKGLLKACDELIVCNDSCYGPVHPLAEMFNEMSSRTCDFWGCLSNAAPTPHIQSFFYVFKQQIFNSQVFERFFNNVTKLESFWDVVFQYEIGLSKLLKDSGFTFDSYVPLVIDECSKLKLLKINNKVVLPLTLTEKYKMPFLKRKLFDTGSDTYRLSLEGPSEMVDYVKSVNPELAEIMSAEVTRDFARNKELTMFPRDVEWLGQYADLFASSKKDKTALLVTHELTFSGAPVSLLAIAKILRNAGWTVKVLSLRDGDYKNEFAAIGVPVFVEPLTPEIVGEIAECSFAIANTCIPAKEVELFSRFIPTVWWLREHPSIVDRQNATRGVLRKSINVVTSSDFSQKQWMPFTPNPTVIRHGIDDRYSGVNVPVAPVRFAVLGMIEERKGQDVFIEAVKKLPTNIRAKAEFFIVGRGHEASNNFLQRLRTLSQNLPQIHICDEITNLDELVKLYESLSAVVVPSRQEPTSRVAIEAMMMGRGAILSNQVGAQYLLDGTTGALFESENSDELSDLLKKLILNPNLLISWGKSARSMYLKMNTNEIFERKIIDIAERVSSMGTKTEFPTPQTLSVVVPVYNAKPELLELLQSMEETDFLEETDEVILINDHSPDTEILPILNDFAGRHPSVRVIDNQDNLGFLKTANHGMEIANGDVVVILNEDTKVPFNFKKSVMHCFRASPKIVIASPVATSSGWFNIPVNAENYQELAKKTYEYYKAAPPVRFTAEGFCFCIRKAALPYIGKFDEILGRGYSEEDELVLRAVSLGYDSVLMRDCLIAHRRHASFSIEGKNAQMAQNRPIFEKRWGKLQDELRDKYEQKQVARKVEDVIRHLSPELVRDSRLAVFASFSKNHCIEDYVVYYLRELKKVCDKIVFVSDNTFPSAELAKIKPYINLALCEHHGEYDFGSYKRGYLAAARNGWLDDMDELILCNDSCYGPIRPLEKLFETRKFDGIPDLYGATINSFGRGSVFSPHVQSYFVVLSRKAFTSAAWAIFINSVEGGKSKQQIIDEYELGMSRALGNARLSFGACYRNFDDPNSNHLYDVLDKGFFLKRNCSRASHVDFEKVNQCLDGTDYPFRLNEKRQLICQQEEGL